MIYLRIRYVIALVYLMICGGVGAVEFVCPGAAKAPQRATRSHLDSATQARWLATSGARIELTYSFVSVSFSYDVTSDVNNIEQEAPSDTINEMFGQSHGSTPDNFPANFKQLIRNAFDAWEAVTNIEFTEVIEPGAEGQIRIGGHEFSINSSILGHGFFPTTAGTGGVASSAGDLHFNSTFSGWTDQVFFVVAVHEIGHTIGLDHIAEVTGATADVLMYAAFDPATTPGTMTNEDIAYVQDVYGPPIPKIQSAAAGDRQISWSYPTDSSGDPVSSYTATITKCADTSGGCSSDTNAVNDDVLIQNAIENTVQSFEIQNQVLVLTSFTDNADTGNRLFVDSNTDGLGSGAGALWRTLDDTQQQDPAVDLAYQANWNDADSLNTYFLSFSAGGQIEATATTKWRFARSYILSNDTDFQTIEYGVENSAGVPISSLSFTETSVEDDLGPTTLGYSDQPHESLPSHVSFNTDKLTFDLGSLAGQEFSVAYIFDINNSPDAFGDEAVYIDDIEITDVLFPSGSPVQVTNTIMPNAASFDLAIPSGEHELRMRAVFTGITPTDDDYSETIRRSLTPSVTVNSTTSNMSSPALSGSVSEPGATVTVMVDGQTRTAVNDMVGGWSLAAGELTVLPDGIYDVQVTATDATTVNDATTNELIVDTVTLALINRVVAGDNSYVEFRFSEPVYRDSAGTIALNAGDFSVTLNNSTDVLSAVKTVTNVDPVGGEMVIRVILDASALMSVDATDTLQVDLVGDVFDGLGEQLTADSIDPIDVGLNGSIEITIEFDPDEVGQPTESLTIRRDAAMMAPVAAGTDPYFYLENNGKLITDARGFEEQSRWELVFKQTDSVKSGTLMLSTSSTLNVGNADTATDYKLYLQRLVNESPSGGPEDLSNLKSTPFSPSVDESTTFEILYGPPQNLVPNRFGAGWNLASIPIVSDQTLTNVFGSIYSKTAWCWDGSRFVPADPSQPLNPEKGYWIFSAAGGDGALVSGLSTDGVMTLDAGWSLAASTADGVSAPTDALGIWGWDAIGQSLFELFPGDTLRFGQAVWIYLEAQETIDLGSQ